MKFIQSVEQTNRLVNLDLVYSIEKDHDYIIFYVNGGNDQISWVGEVEKDWQTICNVLNSDVSSSNIIK